MSTVKTLKVELLTILGGYWRHRRPAGNHGTSSGINVSDLTGKLIASAREQIRAATGIDLAAALRGPNKPDARRRSVSDPRPVPARRRAIAQPQACASAPSSSRSSRRPGGPSCRRGIRRGRRRRASWFRRPCSREPGDRVDAGRPGLGAPGLDDEPVWDQLDLPAGDVPARRGRSCPPRRAVPVAGAAGQLGELGGVDQRAIDRRRGWIRRSLPGGCWTSLVSVLESVNRTEYFFVSCPSSVNPQGLRRRRARDRLLGALRLDPPPDPGPPVGRGPPPSGSWRRRSRCRCRRSRSTFGSPKTPGFAARARTAGITTAGCKVSPSRRRVSSSIRIARSGERRSTRWLRYVETDGASGRPRRPDEKAPPEGNGCR